MDQDLNHIPKRRKLYLSDSSVAVPKSTRHRWDKESVQDHPNPNIEEPQEDAPYPTRAGTDDDVDTDDDFINDDGQCPGPNPVNSDDGDDEDDGVNYNGPGSGEDDEHIGLDDVERVGLVGSSAGSNHNHDREPPDTVDEDPEEIFPLRILNREESGEDVDDSSSDQQDEPNLRVEPDENEEDNYDEINENENAPDQPLYDGSEVTKAQMQVLLLRYIFKHNVNGEQLEDLCKLFDILHPGALPSSKYLFKKALPAHLSYKLHYYCASCKGPIDCDDDDTQTRCLKCDSPFTRASAKRNDNYFVSFPMKEQLVDLLEQHSPKILKKSEIQANPNYVDILSGDVIREWMRSGIINDDDFTLLWGLDGAQAFKNSTVSYWPLLATINELALPDRKRHLVVLGLWFGSEKPVMETFMKPFVKEFRTLGTDGFTWEKDGADTTSRVFLTICTCDAVAQAMIRNCNQFNGTYGCPKCYHQGEQIEKGGGTVRVYPCDYRRAEGQEPEIGRDFKDLRTSESHVIDCQSVVNRRSRATTEKGRNVTVYGVKGPSSLMLLPLFTMISFCNEYMHGVLLGVMKQLFSLWFDTTNHANDWYIGTHVKQLDKLVVAMKPPNEITKTPTFISKRSFWKAHEYKAFLLYYGPGALKGILRGQYYNHFMLLSGAIYLLLEDEISPQFVGLAELALSKFVILTAEIYGRAYVSYNQHQLIHLAESVRKWGPLWAQSAFSFESMNNVLLKMKHGTQHTALQIANAYVCRRSIEKTANVCMEYAPEHVKDLYRRISHIGGYMARNPKMIGGLQVYGRVQNKTLPMLERRAISRHGHDIGMRDAVKTYLRFSTPKFVCHAEEYRSGTVKKRNNCIVQLRSGERCSVRRLVVLDPNCVCENDCDCEDAVLILLSQLEQVDRETPFFRDRHLTRYGFKFDHMCRVRDSEEIIAIFPDQLLRKCISINVQGNMYTMPLVNSKETD